MNLKDALLKISATLPNGSASASAPAAFMDTGKLTSAGDVPGNIEFLLTGPALTTTELPDTKTMVYDVQHSDNADGSSPSTLIDNAITQTGASSAGADAATYRFKLPTGHKRYVGFSASNSGAGNASGKSGTLEVVV